MKEKIDELIIKYGYNLIKSIKCNDKIVCLVEIEISNKVVNHEFIKQINGLSVDRKNVYLNYLASTNETNSAFLYKLYNDEKVVYVIVDVDYSAGEPIFTVCKDINIMNGLIKFRREFLVDIEDEFNLFNQNIKMIESKTPLNLEAKVVENDEIKGKYYTFDIYNNEKLIINNLSNIYNLDLNSLMK